MARPKSRKPAYCRHKPSGRAFVKLDGHRVYLGKHGTPESKDKYDVTVAEWIARGRQQVPASTTASTSDDATVPAEITVAEIGAAFWEHAKGYFVDEEGKPNQHLGHFKAALKFLVRLYGNKPAKEFGPLAIQVVRDEMLKPQVRTDPKTKEKKTPDPWSRGYVNEQVQRLRRVFKWAASRELVPATVLAALETVDGLRAGQQGARETEAVKTVPLPFVEAAKQYLPRQIKTMIDLQLLTGMRPGEVCRLRGSDLRTDGAVWEFRPPKHKTAYKGFVRVVRIGPRAQEILQEFLRPNLQEHLFRPIDADRERREALARKRKTPKSCGNKAGTNRKAKPKKTPGERWTTHSYRAAIVRACRKADAAARKDKPDAKPEDVFVPDWHPHQLRHNYATKVKRQHGLEVAKVILGHRSLQVTEGYTEADEQLATDVVAKIG